MEVDRYSGYKIWQPLLLGLVAALGFYAGIKVKLVQPAPAQKSEIRELDRNHAQKIQDVISYIQSKYVDSIHHDKLIQSALESYIQSLDPYSEYIAPDEFRGYQYALHGRQLSFGAELYFIDSNLVFFNTQPTGSAYQSGIRNGDYVLGLDTLDVAKDRKKIGELLRQIQDSRIDSLRFKVLHRLQNEKQTHELKAQMVEAPSVRLVHLIEDDIVYLKIDQFIKGSYREFMECMEAYVVDKKARNLVIDIRGNPGGLVNEVAYILNQLIYEKEKLLFKTSGFHVKEKEYKSTGNAFFKVGRIAVLMDSCTASAAELFALALKDLNRATIIGDTSYGKSTILEQFNLADGSAIRLAIARFSTLSGKNIQRHHEQTNLVTGISDLEETVGISGNPFKDRPSQALYGVLPDIVCESQNPILQHKEILEYIDTKVLKHLSDFRHIIQDHPDRIYEEKQIKDQILQHYNACPEKWKTDISFEQFAEEFQYALCAWLFNPELEQRDRLRKDEMIRIAIREIKKQGPNLR